MAAAEYSSVVSQGSSLPGSLGYTVKRRLLGPPLVNEQLPAQRLSRPLALGVLSCDGISSAAYGSEEILRALLPFFGLVAFTLVLPMTLVILFGIALVVLSYREVVSVYTKAGGSYVVARENFGPRVAQVAAAALLIDYVVTVAVQTAAGSAAILFTGGNTSFSGFPFLASFVAEDSFLPHWLTKRGHRLAFSSGIIVLTVGSLALLIAVGAQVDGLIPFYAIGVFAGFTLAGFGMARYHRRTREPGWRRRLTINAAGGVYTAAVVVLFTIVKFTEGAWLVVVLFPVLVFTLIRLNRQYRMEAEVLEDLGDGTLPGPPPNYGRRSVIVLIDRLDLAALAALRYANSLRPTRLRAVHFVLDGARADRLREAWVRARLDVPLDLVDCADRRLAQAAAELAAAEASRDDTHVTVVLPRRGYSLLARRLLHDHTADKIAHAVSRIPDSAATIIPFDVQHAVNALGRGKPHSPRLHLAAPMADAAVQAHDRPAVPPGAVPIGSLAQADRSTVEGRVHSVEIRSVGQSCVLACTVADATGQLTALFYGRRHIPGVEPGIMIRLHGTAGHDKGTTMMVNPSYELVCQLA